MIEAIVVSELTLNTLFDRASEAADDALRVFDDGIGIPCR